MVSSDEARPVWATQFVPVWKEARLRLEGGGSGLGAVLPASVELEAGPEEGGGERDGEVGSGEGGGGEEKKLYIYILRI